MTSKTPRDEIIAEVRSVRDGLAAKFAYDLDRLYQEAKRRERVSERPKLEPAPRRIEPAATS